MSCELALAPTGTATPADDTRARGRHRRHGAAPGRSLRMTMLTGHTDHVVNRIRSCVVREEPFVHAIIDGIVPDALYLQMLDQMPPARQFQRAQFGRRRFSLPVEGNAYWSALHAELLATSVTCEIAKRFASNLRPGIDAAQLTLRECTLVVDGLGYSIPPHADSPRKKVLTLLFYLPPDDTQIDLGTCLLRPRAGAPAPSNDYRWYPWKDFDIVQRVDFRPNRLFVFPVTDRSFHAVPRIWRFTRRRSLQAFIA